MATPRCRDTRSQALTGRRLREHADGSDPEAKQYRVSVSGLVVAFPDAEFEVVDQVINGDQAAVFWSQRGRHLGEFCGLAATGRLFHVHGAFYYAFQNREIARSRSIYDITCLLMQIGVLRAKPGF